MDKDRVSYYEIKSWVLENYWDGCRDHGPFISNKNKDLWNLEQIASDVYDGYAGGDGSFDSNLEYLMLEVVSFVLSCWYPKQAEHHKNMIFKIISDNGLANMLEGVPSGEVDDFMHDLKILGFI